jgi:hypothetical protein
MTGARDYSDVVKTFMHLSEHPRVSLLDEWSQRTKTVEGK